MATRSATQAEKLEYINKYSQVIIDSTIGTNLLPSVVMAQAILEGNAGISTLAKKYNNHFGVKAQTGDGWKGLTVSMKTGEQTKEGKKFDIIAKFRHYPSAFDSIKDHNKFVHAKRYAKLKTVNTPQEQLQVLKDNGYATDIHYVSKCMNIIKSYNLTKLDVAKRKQLDPLTHNENNPVTILKDFFKIDSLKK